MGDYYYRVEHSGSQARLDGDDGIVLRRLPKRPIFYPTDDQRRWDYDEWKYGRGVIKNHLNLKNRRPTPCISTIRGDRDAAECLADFLVRAGKRNVVIHTICVPDNLRWSVNIWWMPKLVEIYDLRRPVRENEYIFLVNIPAELIENTEWVN